jgi:anti-sigma regulatory factor (Ser/Thr protein kinase)
MADTLRLMDHRPTDSLTLTLESRSDLATRRAEIRDWMRRRAQERDANDVVLACGEAVDNALEHGTPPVTVEMSWEGGDLLTIVVRDAGTWRVSAELPPRGLGLPIMMALMDNVTVDTTDGTAIRLSRRL